MANLQEKKKLKQKLKTASPTQAKKINQTIQKLEEEEIDAMGQPDDRKAVDVVKEVNKEQDQDHQQRYNDYLNQLDKQKDNPEYYKAMLLGTLNNILCSEGFNHYYKVTIFADDKGIGVQIKTPTYKRFQRLFKVVYEPKYDLAAIFKFAEDTIHFIDHDMHVVHRPEPRILLPN